MKAQKRPRLKKIEAADLPSPKTFETDHSVRSKLRESLTLALRIVDSVGLDKCRLGTRTDALIDDSEEVSKLTVRLEDVKKEPPPPYPEIEKSEVLELADASDLDKNQKGAKTENESDDFDRALEPILAMEETRIDQLKTENETDDCDRVLVPTLVVDETRKEQVTIDFEDETSLAFQTVYGADLDWNLQGADIEYRIDDCDGVFGPMEMQVEINNEQSILRLVEEAIIKEKEARGEFLGGNNFTSHEITNVAEADEIPCKRMKMDSVTVGGDKQEKQAHDLAEKVATDIESELYRQFNGVNRKYKEKARSLLFNLKDRSNPELRARVLSGEITPESLCSMNVEQLASKELSQWRIAKAEELVHMVVLNDADADKHRLVKKTHKGEVEVTVERDDVLTDVVTAGSQQRIALRSKQETEGVGLTAGFPSANAETDNMIKSDSDKLLSSVREPNFAATVLSIEGQMSGYKEERESTSGVDSVDLESKPELNKMKPASEIHSGSISLEASKSRISLKTVDSPNQKSQELEASKSAGMSLIERKKESSAAEKLWEGSFQVANSEISSVIAVYKSGDAMELQNWPKQIEIKGRVRLDALEKFLKELRMSRTRAVMIITCHVNEDYIEQAASINAMKEVANQYQQGERVGYAEPLAGNELYLFPGTGDSLALLKTHGYLTVDQIAEEEGVLVGFVVCKRSLIPAISSYKSSNHYFNANRHVLSAQLNSPTRPNEIHSTGNVNTLKAPNERKNRTSSVSTVNFQKDLHISNHATEGGLHRSYPRSGKFKSEWMEQDEGIDDDLPPGFGPKSLKRRFEMDNDDLPEYDFSSHSTQTNIYVKSSHPLPQPYHVQVPFSQKYGVAGNGHLHPDSLNALDDANRAGLHPSHYARSMVSHSSGQMEQIRTLPSSAQASQTSSAHLSGSRPPPGVSTGTPFTGFSPRLHLHSNESFSPRMSNVPLMDRENFRCVNDERTRAVMPVMQSQSSKTGGGQRLSGNQMRSVWNDDDMPEWHPEAEQIPLHLAMMPMEAGGGGQLSRSMVPPAGWQNARSAALPLASSMVEGAILHSPTSYNRGMLHPLTRQEQLQAFRDQNQ